MELLNIIIDLLFNTIPYILVVILEEGFDMADTALSNCIGGTVVQSLVLSYVVRWCVYIPRDALAVSYQAIIAREVDKSGANNKVNELNATVLCMLAVCCLIADGILILFNDPICTFFALKGEVREFTALALWYSALLMPVVYIGRVLRLFLLVARKQKIIYVSMFVMVVVNIVGDMLSIVNNWGMHGIWMSTIISSFCQYALQMVVIQKNFKFKLVKPSKAYAMQLFDLSKFIVVRDIVQRAWNVLSTKAASTCGSVYYMTYTVMFNVLLICESIVESGSQCMTAYLGEWLSGGFTEKGRAYNPKLNIFNVTLLYSIVWAVISVVFIGTAWYPLWYFTKGDTTYEQAICLLWLPMVEVIHACVACFKSFLMVYYKPVYIMLGVIVRSVLRFGILGLAYCLGVSMSTPLMLAFWTGDLLMGVIYIIASHRVYNHSKFLLADDLCC